MPLTNNEAWFEQVLEASFEAGEPIWRLPLFERDKERVSNSKIADLNNSPGSEGHAIMGGAFIGEFAEDTPWVHLISQALQQEKMEIWDLLVQQVS